MLLSRISRKWQEFYCHKSVYNLWLFFSSVDQTDIFSFEIYFSETLKTNKHVPKFQKSVRFFLGLNEASYEKATVLVSVILFRFYRWASVLFWS